MGLCGASHSARRRCLGPPGRSPNRMAAVTPHGPKRRNNSMPNSISTLLLRNLSEVFGENDPARRRAAIDELWAEDGVFYDPSKGAIRGRDEIDRIAGAVKATHPDFRYQVTAAPEEYCDAGMVPWISGRPGELPAYSGRDFVIARGGRVVS